MILPDVLPEISMTRAQWNYMMYGSALSPADWEKLESICPELFSKRPARYKGPLAGLVKRLKAKGI